MKKYLAAHICLLLLLGTALAQNDRSKDLASVAAAENSFADMAASSGTRAAFLAFAAPDGIVFSDKVENALQNWQKRTPNASLLSWRPSWVDVSADGRLGYTTGTWSFSRSKTEDPVAWGEFFTVWRKEPDGTWKFALDLGIGHEKADVLRDNWHSPPADPRIKPKVADLEIWRSLETGFASDLKRYGARKAYSRAAHQRIRLLREGKMPLQGKQDAMRQINSDELVFNPLGGGSSSDLAFVYGEYELKGATAEKGFYCRVWKLDGARWKIALEVLHPVPPPKN